MRITQAVENERAHVRVGATQINTYKICPRMYYFNYVLKLVPKVESKKLLFGRGIHKGIEAYYKTGSETEAQDVYASWLKEQHDRLLERGADANHIAEAAELGGALLDEYIRFARANDSFSVVRVEQPFSVPLWSPSCEDTQIDHTGTWDGVVRDVYGKLWLMEHKTASSFPTELDLKLNTQNKYYLLAAYQIFGDEVRGTVYNVIRKVNPKRAKSPVIMRRLVPYTPGELLSARDQMYRAVKQMLSDEYFDPVPGHHCNWKCDYAQLCICAQEGIDYSPFVDSMYDRLKDGETGEWEANEV